MNSSRGQRAASSTKNLARHLGAATLHDWIEVPVARTRKDGRPESHKIIPERIKVVGRAKGWAERRHTVFRDPDWHFDCLQELQARERTTRQSIGMVTVREITSLEIEGRSAEDAAKHEAKLKRLQVRGELFAETAKDLSFVPFRPRIAWLCSSAGCKGHTASILDWGLLELGRRDGKEKMYQKLQSLANLGRYDLHLYMGNMHLHRRSFSCIGLWYPIRRGQVDQGVLDL